MEVYGDSKNLINLMGFRNAKVVNEEGSNFFLRVNVDHEIIDFENAKDESTAIEQLANLKVELEAMGS